MNQKEINEQEWLNPENWTKGSKWLIAYFSHKDSRAVVPKKNPKHGWTINFAKPKGVAILISMISGLISFNTSGLLYIDNSSKRRSHKAIVD